MAKKKSAKKPSKMQKKKPVSKKSAVKKSGAAASKKGTGKAVSNKTSARKKTPKKSPSRKAPARKKASLSKKASTAKPSSKKSAPKTSVSKKYGGKKTVSKKTAAAKNARPASPKTKKRSRKSHFLSAKEMRFFRQLLLNLRDRMVDEISFLSGDNLNRSQRDSSGDLSSYSIHMADQGTDNFDREFALNLLSSEQDVIYEIDEALRRIDSGCYGFCELTGDPIEKERLKAIPYARNSVKAQSELERGKTKYRPFGPTITKS